MKKTITIMALTFASAAVEAQTYSGPESVEYDYAGNRYFISNTNSGEILERNAAGTLSVFASGFSTGPHGLEILGNVLYACDGSSLKGYDLSNGNQVLNQNLGATFLNGITNNGTDLFITDFSQKKVFRFDVSANTYNIFVTGLTKTPNGIIYDQPNNRLVMVSWGTNAPIYAISMSDSSVTQATSTTLGNCDGIAMDCQGRFYVSSWSPNRISRFANDFSGGATNMNASGLSSPADIVFNTDTDTLGVPNSGNNTVTFYNYASCLATGVVENATTTPLFLLSSRQEGTITIHFPGNDAKGSYIVSSAEGKIIQKGNIVSHSSEIKVNAAGIYFVTLTAGEQTQTQKVVVR